jgi:hypothetical protein
MTPITRLEYLVIVRSRETFGYSCDCLCQSFLEMQSIFRLALRRLRLVGGMKLEGRGGSLKMYWGKPLRGLGPMGIES